MAFKAKKSEDKHRSHTVDNAIAEVIKDKMVGLNINISERKRATLKAKAAINGDTIQAIIIQAIDKYISA